MTDKRFQLRLEIQIYSITSVDKASPLPKCTILYLDWENWQRPTLWNQKSSFPDLAQLVRDSTSWSRRIPFTFTYFSRSCRRHRDALLLNSNFETSDLRPCQAQPEPRACCFQVVSPIPWDAITWNRFEAVFPLVTNLTGGRTATILEVKGHWGDLKIAWRDFHRWLLLLKCKRTTWHNQHGKRIFIHELFYKQSNKQLSTCFKKKNHWNKIILIIIE